MDYIWYNGHHFWSLTTLRGENDTIIMGCLPEPRFTSGNKKGLGGYGALACNPPNFTPWHIVVTYYLLSSYINVLPHIALPAKLLLPNCHRLHLFLISSFFVWFYPGFFGTIFVRLTNTSILNKGDWPKQQVWTKEIDQNSNFEQMMLTKTAILNKGGWPKHWTKEIDQNSHFEQRRLTKNTEQRKLTKKKLQFWRKELDQKNSNSWTKGTTKYVGLAHPMSCRSTLFQNVEHTVI